MVNVRKFIDYPQIEIDLSSNEEFFVIPDIHGDSEGLLMIKSALENLGVADKQIIYLGDYVGINFENLELTMTDDIIWTRPFEDLGAVGNSSYSKNDYSSIIQDSNGSNRLIMTDTNNWTKNDYRDIYNTKYGAMRIHSNGDIFVGDVKYYQKL